MMSYVVLKEGNLSRETEDAAGWDIPAGEDVIIPPGEYKLVMTDIVTEMSKDVFGKIFDRSGLAARLGISTMAGVIDSQYPKRWGVVLINNGKEPFVVYKGDRIAQVVFIRMDYIRFISDKFITKDVIRTDGFGSTGK